MTERIRRWGNGGGSGKLLLPGGEEHVHSRFSLMVPVLLILLGLAGSAFITAASVRNGNDDLADAEGEDEIEVSLSREGLRPGSGTGGTTFLFTVTVTSAGKPDETSQSIEVIINQRAHRMKEIDPEDRTYQDGKDFYYRDKLETGGVVYFFRCGNVTTTSRSLSVAETRAPNYHYDVAVIMSLFVIPVIIGVWIFRKIERYSQEMTMALIAIAQNPGNDMKRK